MCAGGVVCLLALQVSFGAAETPTRTLCTRRRGGHSLGREEEMAGAAGVQQRSITAFLGQLFDVCMCVCVCMNAMHLNKQRLR